MVGEGFFSQTEHEGEAKLHALRRDEVSLATNDEGTCLDEHTCWGCLGDLAGIHPVYLGEDFVLPAWTVAHLESGCLVQGEGRHWMASWVLDDTYSCSMELRVHEEIGLVHVSFDKGFVLLGIPSSDD